MCFLCSTPARADAETVTVVVNHAPPYRIIEKTDGEGRYSGFYIDIANEMAKRANLKLAYQEMPFKRALKMMANGSADLMLGPNKTSIRESYMVYLDEKLPRERKVFYLSPKAPDIRRYSQLRHQSVAVLRGAVYFDPFDGDQTHSKVKIENYESGLKMVAASRINTVIIPELLGDYLLNKLDLHLKKASFGHKGRSSYFAISKQSSLINKLGHLNAILNDMKKDGTFQRLQNRNR